MNYAESILKVLVVGLVLGAGLPAVFAVGLVAYSSGAGGDDDRRHGARAEPGAEVPRAGAVRVRRLGDRHRYRWITRTTIIHHFGFDPFPFMPK